MRTFPAITTTMEAKMTEAGLKIPDVKTDAKRDAVATPTKRRPTFVEEEARTSSFGKSRLKHLI